VAWLRSHRLSSSSSSSLDDNVAQLLEIVLDNGNAHSRLYSNVGAAPNSASMAALASIDVKPGRTHGLR
jgi:hypothetical protein